MICWFYYVLHSEECLLISKIYQITKGIFPKRGGISFLFETFVPWKAHLIWVRNFFSVIFPDPEGILRSRKAQTATLRSIWLLIIEANSDEPSGKVGTEMRFVKDADSNTYSIDISSLRSIRPCAGLQKGESPFMFGKTMASCEMHRKQCSRLWTPGLVAKTAHASAMQNRSIFQNKRHQQQLNE